MLTVFSLVYVLLPFSDTPPAEAITASMARFERGQRGDIPEEWLAFHDETDLVERAWRAPHVFSKADSGGLSMGAEAAWVLDGEAIRAAMGERGLTRWSVRFEEIEPSLERFVERYVRDIERHPITGGYGRWLNGLGRWDWWDLGGRFDGAILGERAREGRRRSAISSGLSTGRQVLENLGDALRDALGQGPPPETEVETDLNIELTSRLLEDAEADRPHAFPGALLLPPGDVPDEHRWLSPWPEMPPAESLGRLDLAPETPWPEIVRGAYRRWPDHWAAGVAYHL